MFKGPHVTYAPIGLGTEGGSGGGGATKAAALPASPTSTPRSDAEIIEAQIEILTAWAVGNDNDAKNDRRRYWVLKIPAILFAASTSALETFGFHSAVIVMGVVSAVCVAIDAAYPGGLLHNVHRQAANEIFLLRDSVQTDRDKLTVQFRDASTPEEIKSRRDSVLAILNMVQKEKLRINEYLTAAEASLDKKRRTD